MEVSVIIPTFNEEKTIAKLLDHLHVHSDHRMCEVIVADGKSTDKTLEVADENRVRTVICPHKGRSNQMNYAASLAKGDVLYFVHADSIPPASFLNDIKDALDEGYLLGGYQSQYISQNPLFRINTWFTQSKKSFSHGGDQTLYVYRDLFEQLGGFCEKHVIMEEFEFVKRARRVAVFKKIPKQALVSTRKYDDNSYIRVTLANTLVFGLYQLGVAPSILKKTYQFLIR